MSKEYSKRLQWMKNLVIDSLKIPSDNHWAVTLPHQDCLTIDHNKNILYKFLDGEGPQRIFVHFQLLDQKLEFNSNSQPVVFFSYGDTHKINDKAIYFLRNTPENKKPVSIPNQINLNQTSDLQVLWGQVTQQSIKIMNHLMEFVFEPILFHQKTQSEWTQCDTESKNQFLTYTQKFKKQVNEALKLMSPEKELFKFEPEEEQKLQTMSQNQTLLFYQQKFQNWIKVIEGLLSSDTNIRNDGPDPGPKTQFDYWRSRMQIITNWSQQLKSKDFNQVKMALIKHKQLDKKDGQQNITKLMISFNRLDLNLTDRLNEAKDNVKYLSTLQKFIEPLYSGTPQDIIETLPALMNAIKMIHTIARFYNTSDKMTGLFVKITNRMIKNCKDQIIGPGERSQDIWKKNPLSLIKTLTSCIQLNKEYKESYMITKQKVSDMPKGKTFDFNETQIFSKFDAFCKRLRKLIDIFSNIEQFNALQKHNLEGMSNLTFQFNAILEEFKRKRRDDLLDMSRSQFDRDYVQFNVEISKLDTQMQKFIDQNFNLYKNIEYSLKLLKKFEATIKRDALRNNLQQKYNAILYNYATELDNITKIFQDQRADPPTVRNMPDNTGKIIWSRHLFQKITAPIYMFPQNVVNSTQIKKYYGNYNSLGKQLTINQMWYFNLWNNQIEKSKAALQATLIVRHQKTGKLYVNFDSDIIQLIREAKCLDRQGIQIPEGARIILLQEQKFKSYYNQLKFLLDQHQRIIQKVKPICKQLLYPHIADFQLRLYPGMSTLTWTSMNIENYIRSVQEGLAKLQQLILSCNDIIENRIESNLLKISKMVLIKLPEGDITFTLQNFVSMQQEYINSQRSILTQKNLEIQKSVDDLVKVILLYNLDVRIEPVKVEDTKKVLKYYFWYLYQALLQATQNSLNLMKNKVCGTKGSSQTLHPFFEVDVQLQAYQVRLNPSLELIQKAINKASIAVIRCTKDLHNWNVLQTYNNKKISLYDLIAKDKQIVKVILLLTGSIQGTKNKVKEFLSKFDKFSWLWRSSLQSDLKEFKKKGDIHLSAYQLKLREFNQIEKNISNIEAKFVIGANVLKTGNLVQALKLHVKDWKYLYSEDLHKKAKNQLQNLSQTINEISQKLSKTVVKDIDTLGIVMQKLQEIRKMQTVINIKFDPVFQMYKLLDNYLPQGLIDKDQMDQREMLQKNWDNLIIQKKEIIKKLSVQQGHFLKTLKSNVKQLVKDIKEFREDYQKNGPMVEGIEPKQAIQRLKRFQEQCEVRQQQFKINRKGQDLFGLQNQQYPALQKTKAQIINLNKLYKLYIEVIKSIAQFQELPWLQATPDKLIAMQESGKKYKEMCQNLPRDLKEWQAYKQLRHSIQNLQAFLPLIQLMKKDAIQPRHWELLNQKTQYRIPYDQLQSFFVQDLIKAKVLDLQDEIEEIAESAQKQKKIRIQMDEIKKFWDVKEFEFAGWGKRENCILNGLVVLDVTQKLEEDQMNLSSINAQKHVAPFKKEVQEIIKNFSEASENLDLWIKVQILWTSLEPVFTGGDIAKQMPIQAKQFLGIDKTWIKCMEKAVETKKVIMSCQSDLLKDNLPEMQKKLEDCQKMLQAYLQGKRKQFPRFYFVSNPTLLKILSQGSEPMSIQDDFQKLFDAITKVQFGKDTEKKGSNIRLIKTIIQEIGKDTQLVPLVTPVRCEGNIEIWLGNLQRQMQSTIRARCSRASVATYDVKFPVDFRQAIRLNQNSLKSFVDEQISQISLMGIMLIWTTKMTQLIQTKPEKGKGDASRKGFVDWMMRTLSEICLQPINSNLIRTKIQTLVTIHVHSKDITEGLRVQSVNDFDWQKQTRLYWKSDISHCLISITDYDQIYSYQFLGAKERLCITPLTDRCYIALAQALSMYYGGSPAGPAGTGKTETVKDLGRTLGIFVVVTNCSDQHRYKDMAKIFKGLAQSGLWGCFDQFNRIQLEVLSVVAMQVQAIGMAKKQHAKTFMFPEQIYPINIILSVGYFITMNPGYMGRQQLPQNLKMLFRGVTMMVPDREIIIKVKLASVGYEFIGLLSKKFNVLYRLCQEQLSKQRHYDFGLRNILSVLRTAGNTKREQKKPDLSTSDKKQLFQEMLLYRSLRDMNFSKLVADDIPLFEGLLRDIFPRQTSVEKKIYADVMRLIPVYLKKRPQLINRPEFNEKIIQLYQTNLVRHGFMLVGLTGTGKSTIMNILLDVLSQIDKPYRIMKLNPKAITDKQMYGVKSELSDDWIPGIFSTLWQRANSRNNKYVSWLTCDGPVDAIWIENLNTVLDDNKILTLANGERIPMSQLCKLVFEVQNLNNANPSTVSRCGQVYISPGDLGYQAVYEGWCNLRKQEKGSEEAVILKKLLKKYFSQWRIIQTISKTIKNQPVMDLNAPVKVANTCNLINGILKPLTSGKLMTQREYEKVVVFAVSWVIGGLYESPQRAQYHELIGTKGAPLPQSKKESQTIFDYFCSIQQGKCQYKQIEPEKWKPKIGKIKFSQLLLPTIDSQRAEYLILSIFQQPKPVNSSTAFLLNSVVMTGGPGTAKTSSSLMLCNKYDPTIQLYKRINFSSATQPHMFQTAIEQQCDFKVGKKFAPPGNKKMTIFIDDFSMPFVNVWGDQVTLEIVRQLMEQGGFYWLDKAQRGNFKSIENLSFIGAMNHPGGGRNDIPNRLKRLCFIFNMILPLSIEAIYGQIIRHQFKLDLKQSGFSDQVKKVIESLTTCTIKLWDIVKKNMLPTPAKFHYVFNMRQISRIFKGIFQIKKETIVKSRRIENLKPQIFMIALWKHECERVFADKLINNNEKNTVNAFINQIALHGFGQEALVQQQLPQDSNIMFLSFMDKDQRDEDGVIIKQAIKVYQGMSKIEQIRERCNDAIETYNIDVGSKAGRKLELVLFDDAIGHLLRISRILEQARSNSLLVGVGGSGKQSLTRLASYIGKMQTRQIILAKNYQIKDLLDDLKSFFDLAGHLGKITCFILTDSQIKKQDFLQYINMILSTGEIAGLFAKDQLQSIRGDIRNDYVKEKGQKQPTPIELYNYFVERVRDNLHIVLCFSPVGQKFRDRSRKFPALFNECTIDWFLTWPQQALVSVAETFIRKFKQLDTTEQVKQNLMIHMSNVHIMVRQVCEQYFLKLRRQVYVTPKSYLSYLQSYKLLYKTKYHQLDLTQQNFTIGVRKIDQASQAIKVMKIALTHQESELKQATQKTQALLADLEKQQKKAKIKGDQVAETTANCQHQANQITQAKLEAQKDLQAALPAMIRAQQAVQSLEPKMITQMKSLKRVPPIFQFIMDAVCILFGAKINRIEAIGDFSIVGGVNANVMKTSYQQSGKIILSDINFLKNLKTFDKDSISNEAIELLEPYTTAEWFNEKNAGRASFATQAILKWVLAIVEYHQKSQIVKPKKIKLAQQEARLQMALQDLAKAKTELNEIKELLAQLDKNSQIEIEKKNQLQIKSNRTKKKIITAETLINSLTDQRNRWKVGASSINQEKKRLVGDCSLATAFTSYCGPFSAEFRYLMANDKFVADMKAQNVPCQPSLSNQLTSFLVDQATVGQWNLQGLPKDDLSIQNGIMMTNSTRYPLLIDPQGQGQNWIMKKYSDEIDKNHSITHLNHPKFKDNFLRFCIEEGKTLIIENIQNEVDPVMDPVLQKQIIFKKTRGIIEVGGVQWDFHKNFRLFMTCRLSNPSFSPQLSAKTTIINFTVTQKGLQQQLLGKVISKEQKALQDSLQQLLADVNFNKKELQKLDKNLLQRLNQSEGNLLQDKQLMDVLKSTKTQAKQVAVKIADSETKTKEINQKREQYRPVAIRGAAIYFTIIELANVNWMYNSSLEQFLVLFNESIDLSQKTQNPSKRVDIIIRFLTFHIYRYINRGLFQKDKITFILMMCFKILITAGKITNADVSLFLKAGAAQDIKTVRPKPTGNQFLWLNDKAWLNIIAFSKHCFMDSSLPTFKQLPQLVQKNMQGWKTIFQRNDPQNSLIPDLSERLAQQKDDIRQFMQMALIRAIRQDRTLIASNGFIAAVLGKEFTEPISYPIEGIWAQSTSICPILYLLSAGADPTSSIDQLARKKKKFPVEKVSMGEGQQQVARKAIHLNLQGGGWVALQNCHLGLKFMQEIDQMIINWKSEGTKPHEDFRLWITCEQHPRFPLGLLQKTIKVTNQPPKGMKAGMYKTFTTLINQQFIEKVDHLNWRNIMFTICFLHSVVIERRKFGPLGWCIPYEFNSSDLEASLLFIEKYLTNLMGGSVSSSQVMSISNIVVRYMVCQVQYGGRITDDLDRQLFSTFGQKYLNDSVYNSNQNQHTFYQVMIENVHGLKQRYKYKIPFNQGVEHSKYMEYIMSIPASDTPQVFGLHPNADLTFRLKQSIEMINTIMETRPKEGGGGSGKSRQQEVKDKAKQLIIKLPLDYLQSEVKQQVKKLPGPKALANTGMSVPMNIFLFQQIQRMQKVISIVRKTLIDIVDAIDGQIIMTPQILDAIYSLFDAKVPNQWIYDATGQQISWIIPTLAKWFNDLIERNRQLYDWMKGNRPSTYWLGGFFNPQGFLTAMKQQVTRQHKTIVARPGAPPEQPWSLDDVVYLSSVKQKDIEVLKEGKESKDIEGVFIRDLMLQGCRWSKGNLDQSRPRELFAPLPLLFVTASNKKRDDRSSSFYNCPVYKYQRRTDNYLIFRVNLPCQQGTYSKWKLRGVALLCAND